MLIKNTLIVNSGLLALIDRTRFIKVSGANDYLHLSDKDLNSNELDQIKDVKEYIDSESKGSDIFFTDGKSTICLSVLSCVTSGSDAELCYIKQSA